MFRRLLRNACLLIGLMLFLQAPVLKPVIASPVHPAGQTGQQSQQPDLERLAAALDLPVNQLQFGNQETITLANGKQLTEIKAMDTRTNQIVGAAFDGDKVVDLAAESRRAYAEWRAAHAALTPALVEKMAASAPSERYTIAVWLNVKVEALPKPDLAPAGPAAPPDPLVPTTSGEGALPEQASRSASGDQAPAGPVPLDQLPPAVRAALFAPAGAGAQAAAAPAEISKPAGAVPPPPPADAENERQRAALEAFDRQNQEHLRAQIAPARASFLDDMAALGYPVQYASETTPVVFLTGLNRSQVEALALRPDVDAIYDASLPGGPSLEVARVTQNVNLLEDWGGYTGAGVKVAIVEGTRVFEDNPFLTVFGRRDNTRTPKAHPTGVGGIVASTHSTRRGMAPGAHIYSANGDDYATIAAVEAAMDWGSANAAVLNHSFWAAECGMTSALSGIDRHMDYIVRYNYDFAAVAAGNFKTGGCIDTTTPSPYVSSPGKGYNPMTVGNFNDGNTNGWSDDVMMSDSQYNDTDRWKPELAASGTGINSTTLSDPWTGDIGWGTSYASPMVAGLAADMIQAKSTLADEPEAIGAVLMATALHNIAGASSLSRTDGTGAIDGSAALASLERNNYYDIGIESSTAFPLNYNQYAYKGEVVRVAIRWLSNPDGGYTTDVLPVDLDLTAYRADGTTVLASSANILSNLEIVEFTAPATETYNFKVTKYGGWTGSNTWLGIGIWRGVYRVSPDVGYTDPQATPLGTHLAVLPADFSPSNYWRAFGIRSASTNDHDLRLYDRSWFDDPSQRNQLESSTFGTGGVDFVVVDGNHWSSSAKEFQVVNYWSGTGGYDLNWSNLGWLLGPSNVYGPFSMTSAEVVRVFDIDFFALKPLKITLIPDSTNSSDLAIELFKSTDGLSTSYTDSRGGGVKRSDISTLPSQVEALVYGTTEADYLGLVVYKKQSGAGKFYISVQYNNVYLPAVRRK